MPRTPEQERLFEASGRVKSSDPLLGFLYLLMREHLPVGKVAAIIPTVEEAVRKSGADPLSTLYDQLAQQVELPLLEHLLADARSTPEEGCDYTNGWLARYAEHLAAILRAALSTTDRSG